MTEMAAFRDADSVVAAVDLLKGYAAKARNEANSSAGGPSDDDEQSTRTHSDGGGSSGKDSRRARHGMGRGNGPRKPTSEEEEVIPLDEEGAKTAPPVKRSKTSKKTQTCKSSVPSFVPLLSH